MTFFELERWRSLSPWEKRLDQSQVYRLITSLGDFNSVTAPCFTYTGFGNEIKACVHVACRRQGRLRSSSLASALR
ncbi:MAG: hypothetical protein KME22_27865 [Hassallia sp. WJT32-NPBG1]|nr:hypothetical protein [Hassallia sp. WJT32-NPBG1]